MRARTLAPSWQFPFHPARAVASAPTVARLDPASAAPVSLRHGQTWSAASDLTTAEFTRSIALELQSAGASLPATSSVVRFCECWPAFAVHGSSSDVNAGQAPHFRM